ncbi:MAG: hypothetical protein Q8P24_02665 [Desulfobacterales bacterium]|nr:hypothetical protein [Desulfobacterales bacterium]
MGTTINFAGIIFMTVGWLFIICLNVFCFLRILREKKEKIIGPLEVEVKIDKADK